MQARMRRSETVPAELTSPRAKLVYLYLSTNGASTVEDLADGLAMTKMSLFSVLSTLRERGLVGRERDRYDLA